MALSRSELAITLLVVEFLLGSLLPAYGLQHGRPGISRAGLRPEVQLAVKPELQLSFEGRLRMERDEHGAPAGAEVMRIAMDVGRRALATSSDEDSREGMVLNLLQGERTEVERFFEEEVCYIFDLEGGGKEPKYKDDYSAADFTALVSSGLGVPLDLYGAADEALGTLNISGTRCDVWGYRLDAEVPMPSQTELEGMGFSREQLDKLRRADGGTVNISDSVTFCVDASGLLHASNVSETMSVQGSRAQNYTGSDMLHTKTARLVLESVHSLDANTTAFAPGGRATGGRCLNLTSGSAREAELKRAINDGKRLHRINEEAKGLWTAAPYHHWHNMMVSDVTGMFGTSIRPLQLPLRRTTPRCNSAFSPNCRFAVSAPPPTSFDARAQWQDCPSIRTVRNQGVCGSCWVVAAVTVLADRFCIEAQKSQASGAGNLSNLSLSPQYVLDCGTADGETCSGGRLDDAWHFLQNKGAPSESCDPYTFCPDPSDPMCGFGKNLSKAAPRGRDATFAARHATFAARQSCSSTCASGAAAQPFRAGPIYAVAAPGDVNGMQQDMLLHGPIEAAFFVFSDFMSYREGTYFRTPSATGPLGGHAVRLIGWGTDQNSTDYWLVSNSYGPSWGMDGFFRIRRGTNECGIETMPAAGIPLLPGVTEASPCEDGQC